MHSKTICKLSEIPESILSKFDYVVTYHQMNKIKLDMKPNALNHIKSYLAGLIPPLACQLNFTNSLYLKHGFEFQNWGHHDHGQCQTL